MPAADPAAGGVAGRARRWGRGFVHAPRRFFGMFLYLWGIFGLLLLHESVVLARYNIPFTRWGVGFASAFVLAKIMLVMEEFRVARGFEARPLIYPIVYKSIVFAVVFMAFYAAEETVTGLARGKTFAESIPSIGGGTPLGVLAATIIVSVALLPYFAFRELGNAIGEEEFHALLFTRRRDTRRGDGAVMS